MMRIGGGGNVLTCSLGVTLVVSVIDSNGGVRREFRGVFVGLIVT